MPVPVEALRDRLVALASEQSDERSDRAWLEEHEPLVEDVYLCALDRLVMEVFPIRPWVDARERIIEQAAGRLRLRRKLLEKFLEKGGVV